MLFQVQMLLFKALDILSIKRKTWAHERIICIIFALNTMKIFIILQNKGK